MKIASCSSLLAALIACGGLLGCDDIIGALGLSATGERQLSDKDAFSYLSMSYQSAPTTDMEAVREVIAEEADAQSSTKARKKASEDSEGAIALKKSVIQARKNIDTRPDEEGREAHFKRIDISDWKANIAKHRIYKTTCNYSVDLNSLKSSDYMIPNVNKVPVKDQGSRGTCAAFAGTATVEYAALNSVASQLSTLDLSEQRFYYISKPECQASGCSVSDSGSFYGSGFEESVKASSFDIPLETDCPYKSTTGSNDLQTPQKSSCSTGSAKVKSVANYCGAQGIIDMLNKGYAVPFGSPLTANWENNDGMITKKDFAKAGSSIHAGGHAYLIVGYKKVSSDEGGVCFYVKNSWGTGWGVKGYACMTLEWVKAIDSDPTMGFQFLQYEHPIAIDVDVVDDLKDGVLPADNTDEDEVAELPAEDVVSDDAQEPEDPEENEVTKKTEPDDSDWEDANLLGTTEAYYKVEVADLESDAGQLFVRGILRSSGDYTTNLVLDKKGKKLYVGEDQVGSYDGSELDLCTGEWAYLCSLRYRDSDRKLYLQFRDDDLRKVSAEELEKAKSNGKWYDVNLGHDEEYGLFVPNKEALVDFVLNPKTYLKLGSSTPSRLSLRINAWNKIGIRVQGEEVGELNLTSPLDSSLCNNKYADTCSIFGKDSLNILPSNKRNN